MPPNIARATSRDNAAVLRDAEGRGWSLTLTRRNHVRCARRFGSRETVVFASLTARCPRSVRNLAADLRRAERAAGGVS